MVGRKKYQGLTSRLGVVGSQLSAGYWKYQTYPEWRTSAWSLGLKLTKGIRWRRVVEKRVVVRRGVEKGRMMVRNVAGKWVVVKKTCEKKWCE